MAFSVGFFIGVEDIAMPALTQRRECSLRRQHAGLHRVVAALDARHVYEARAAADQGAARKDELGHGLEAAFGDRSRTVDNALSAFEVLREYRVMLDPLKLVEWRHSAVAKSSRPGVAPKQLARRQLLGSAPSMKPYAPKFKR